jgi:Ca2+-binding EF-hand superfamily protein
MKWYFSIIASLLVVNLAGCGSTTPGTSTTTAKTPAPTEKLKRAPEKVKPVETAKATNEKATPKKAKAAEVTATAKDTNAVKAKVSVPVTTAEAAKSLPEPPTERFLLFTPTNPLIVEVELTIDGQPHLAAMEKLVDEVLKLGDTDGDKRPTWKEVAESKRFKYGQFGNLAISSDNGVKQILEMYDTNRNGTVDRAEVPRFLTRNAGGARPFSIRGTSDFRETSRYESPLWNLLNTDGDRHSISAAEIAAASSRLSSRDTDDDDVVVPADLAANIAAMPGEMPTRRRDRGPTAARLIASDAKWDMIRVDLDDQYALGGNLTAESFPWTPKLFTQLDADKNGRVTKAEYQLLDKVPAHIRLAVNFGKSAKSEAKKDDAKDEKKDEEKKPEEAVRVESPVQIRVLNLCDELDALPHSVSEQSGRLTLNIGGMCLTFYTNDTVAAVDFEAQAKQALEMYDADKNGYLEAKEVPADAQAAFGTFEGVDTDEDGKVYPGEIVTYLSQQQAALRSQVHAKAVDREDAFFLVLDENGDERLDGREIENAPIRLRLFDKNGDGEIVGDEIPPAMVVGFSRGSLQNVDALFVMPSLVARPPAKEVPRWFTLMDTSGDGVISGREFLGEQEQFEKLDVNKDGFLDAVEVKATEPK